jgi:hypothetical protein
MLRCILPSELKNAKIFMPGIGHSTLAHDLKHAGASDIVVSDLNEDEVGEHNRSLHPHYFDLRDLTPTSRFAGTFDYIIDSSVTDVFMQLAKGAKRPNVALAKRIHAALLSMLKPSGTMIVFSMNCGAWETICDNKMWKMCARIRPTIRAVTSRKRPIRRQGDDVLVLVASRKPRRLRDATMQDENAQITAWYRDLPKEDWVSERV